MYIREIVVFTFIESNFNNNQVAVNCHLPHCGYLYCSCSHIFCFSSICFNGKSQYSCATNEVILMVLLLRQINIFSLQIQNLQFPCTICNVHLLPDCFVSVLHQHYLFFDCMYPPGKIILITSF